MAADLQSVLGGAAERWPVPGTRVDFSDMSLSAAEEPAHEGASRGSSDDTSETSEASLIGAEVTIPISGGRRARGVIEELGYLVKLENGQMVWSKLEDIEIE